VPLDIEIQILLFLVNVFAPEDKAFVHQPGDDIIDTVHDRDSTGDEKAQI
jgi:hypothetical protein